MKILLHRQIRRAFKLQIAQNIGFQILKMWAVFVSSWKHENNYACPPVSLISRTIVHMRNCRATGTMILPAWHSALFWQLIYSFKDKSFESFITEFMEIPNKKDSFILVVDTQIIWLARFKFHNDGDSYQL